MTYDEKVPFLLKREQQWFGSIISRPIDEDSKMNPISPSGKPMEVEAAQHIAASPTMRPAQRIQIYNQQYWWRLLNTMHESFPLVTRLFGYYDFNRTIGIPYLTKYNSRHWSLSYLGDRLVKWIEEDYHADDKRLVVDAAKLDEAFIESFITGQVPPLSQGQLAGLDENSEIFSKELFLQPHIYLFKFEYELFRYRLDFLKHDPDYWLENDFPVLDRSKQYHFILFRNAYNDIAWKEISECEYLLLQLFKKGASIDAACEWIEGQEQSIGDEAVQNMQKWFQEWSMRGWLSLTPYQVEGPAVAQAEVSHSHCCGPSEGLQPVYP